MQVCCWAASEARVSLSLEPSNSARSTHESRVAAPGVSNEPLAGECVGSTQCIHSIVCVVKGELLGRCTSWIRQALCLGNAGETLAWSRARHAGWSRPRRRL